MNWPVCTESPLQWCTGNCHIKLPFRIWNGLEMRMGKVQLSFFRSVYKYFIDHFKNYRNMNVWAFFWRISMEVILLAILFGMGISYFFSKYCKDPFRAIPFPVFIVWGIVVAPIIETGLFQTIPISVSRRFKLHFNIQVLSGILLFALVHIAQGALIGFVSGVIGGFYLSFSYSVWIERKSRIAFLMTAGIHSIYNFVLIFFYILVQKI